MVKDECQTRRVRLTLAALDHQEMNGQVEVTWRTLRTFVHSLMVHVRVPEEYIHFALMYTIYHIFLVLPSKDLINEDGNLTTPHKLAQVQNLQYHIHACYFVHVLYVKLRRTLRQRR